MARIHPGATLTPHFRDFLPPWVARQPWYAGTGTPALSPVGYFRFEDPAGEAGIETHLTADGPVLYQLPLTYRGAPLPGSPPQALAATTEHSVLGTRWIYDGEADPVWRSQLLQLIRTGGAADPSRKPGVGLAGARGRPLIPAGLGGGVRIELIRRPVPGPPPEAPGVAGFVMGSWQPAGPAGETVTGCLAVAWRAAAESS